MGELTRTNTLDMHIHSVYSDAPGSTLELITETFKRKKMGGCICDHNEIRGSMELFEQGKITTIPSIEIGSLERLEFLLYFAAPEDLEDFYVHHVEPYKRSRYYTKLTRSFVDLIPAAKDYGAAVALPHPYAPSWKNVNFGKSRKIKLFEPKMFSKIDCIEVINGHLTENRNYKAYLLAEMFDKAAIAGSDSHLPQTLGTVYCEFDEHLDYLEILQIFTSGLKLGMTEKFSVRNTAIASRKVIESHVKLFVSRKNQKRWMVKYDAAG